MPTPKFKKGHAKKGGRKKGSLNKFTTLKQSFLDAYNSKGMGSTQGLIDAFSVNPITRREFYKTISKMLPTNADLDIKGDLGITIKRIISDERPEE